MERCRQTSGSEKDSVGWSTWAMLCEVIDRGYPQIEGLWTERIEGSSQAVLSNGLRTVVGRRDSSPFVA